MFTYLYAICILCALLILFKGSHKHKKETFITSNNCKTIAKNDNIYTRFTKENPHLTLIDIKKIKENLSIIWAYDKYHNIMCLYELHKDEYKKVDVFLYNEYDNDLNILFDKDDTNDDV